MKIGLEIHQRLATNKLFCSCPYLLIDKDQNGNVIRPDKNITRRLHPVLSEMGEVDQASQQEFAKEKTYEYYAYDAANCLVDIDEEPPHELNKEALETVLQIAKQLNSNPVEEIHIMRKIIIDGSIISGFQRTAIITLGGYLETSKGRVGITQISLEEESAGVVETGKEKSIFKLDRMGIPLIEITTDPDIKDAEHLSEVAEKIGLIMRATGKVARGIGTIRQDVNVSVEGGARVEIKGAQDLKMLPTLVEEEVKRQENLIAINKEIKGRDAEVKTDNAIDLTGVFNNTNSTLIKNGISKGYVVLGITLKSFKNLVGREIQTGRRFGTELSDYAKIAGVKGIIHSDEDLSKYGSTDEIEAVKKTPYMNFVDGDAFVLVVADKETATRALAQVRSRLYMKDIPKETRKANPDGTTSYMRPLSGKARLYPETDIPPIKITEAMIKNAGKGESLEEKEDRLLELLGGTTVAEAIIKSRNLSLFEKLVGEWKEPRSNNDIFTLNRMGYANLIVNTLENTLVSLRREGFELKNLDVLYELFQEYMKGKFVRAAIPEILKAIVKTNKSVSEIVKELGLERISEKQSLQKVTDEFKGDMQKIMQKYRLKIESSDLEKLLYKN